MTEPLCHRLARTVCITVGLLMVLTACGGESAAERLESMTEDEWQQMSEEEQLELFQDAAAELDEEGELFADEEQEGSQGLTDETATHHEYDSGLVITLVSLEDITEEYEAFYEELGSDVPEGDLPIRVTWQFENAGTEDLPVDLMVNSHSVTRCLQGKNRYEAPGLYGEQGLVWGPEAPTRLSAGTSFEYFETCVLTPGEPWFIESTPGYTFGDDNHPPFTIAGLEELL